MSPHFGRCPCPDNLIQIESGPSLENLVKELRYSCFYSANPGQTLIKSMQNNTFDKTPLGGDFTPMSHGFDNPTAKGMLPDIHPCGNSTEEKHCDSAQQEDVVENLKEEASNEESFNICYIVTGLLLLVLIIAIIFKLRGM
jgi:hypothetical protein